jgi:hypothetical protein
LLAMTSSRNCWAPIPVAAENIPRNIDVSSFS